MQTRTPNFQKLPNHTWKENQPKQEMKKLSSKNTFTLRLRTIELSGGNTPLFFGFAVTRGNMNGGYGFNRALCSFDGIPTIFEEKSDWTLENYALVWLDDLLQLQGVGNKNS